MLIIWRLATVYLGAMQPAALRAREQGRHRRGPALPGIVGRLFVGALEPPVKFLFTMKSPRKIRPRAAPSLAEALAAFVASQNEVRSFLHENADLDLAAVRFPNPFVPGIRFSLATGLHVIAAHEDAISGRHGECAASRRMLLAGQPSNSV